MKIAFRKIKLSRSNKEKLDVVNGIIKEYQAGGYTLTLRQLYYQLVSRDIIPNQVKEYAKISKLLKEGRMAGIVDWNAIEDRTRAPYTPSSWETPADIMDSAVKSFQLPRMKGQSNYVEVWVEKDALSGVLKRVTAKYHVPIMVNRGYSSASAMFDSYERFADAIEAEQFVTILYLGDYDPSGMDMIRDVRERIMEFFKGSSRMLMAFNNADKDSRYTATRKATNFLYEEMPDASDNVIEVVAFHYWLEARFDVKPIALTLEQIEFYNPPENPAKRTDPRARKFIAKLGSSSWEVDALKPEVLHTLLDDEIKGLIDIDLYDDIVSQEAEHVEALRESQKTVGLVKLEDQTRLLHSLIRIASMSKIDRTDLHELDAAIGWVQKLEGAE